MFIPVICYPFSKLWFLFIHKLSGSHTTGVSPCRPFSFMALQFGEHTVPSAYFNEKK